MTLTRGRARLPTRSNSSGVDPSRHDRDLPGLFQRNADDGPAGRHDHIDRHARQLCRELPHEGVIAIGDPKFENDVAAFCVAEIAQPRSKCVGGRRIGAVLGREEADARDL